MDICVSSRIQLNKHSEDRKHSRSQYLGSEWQRCLSPLRRHSVMPHALQGEHGQWASALRERPIHHSWLNILHGMNAILWQHVVSPKRGVYVGRTQIRKKSMQPGPKPQRERVVFLCGFLFACKLCFVFSFIYASLKLDFI